MTRTETITLSSGYVAMQISLKRDERKIFIINGSSGDIAMTISTTAGGDPLVEIPGTSNIDIKPELISSLTEGETYYVNLWDMSDSSYPQLNASGTLTIGETIVPSDVSHPTQWLDGADVSAVTVLTQAEYDALGTYDADVLYVVTA